MEGLYSNFRSPYNNNDDNVNLEESIVPSQVENENRFTNGNCNTNSNSGTNDFSKQTNNNNNNTTTIPTLLPFLTNEELDEKRKQIYVQYQKHQQEQQELQKQLKIAIANIIAKVPKEVWIHILSFLNERDLLNVSFVDSFLYQISQDNFLWKPLYIKKWNVITLPHKKRISIDRNQNQFDSNNNNNNSEDSNPNNTNSNNETLYKDFDEYYNNQYKNELLATNNTNINCNNNNNLNNNLLNTNLNSFVHRIFKPKLNIYQINSNDDPNHRDSFLNHLPIWKSLYRERKLIVKDGGMEEFYHLLETLIAYPLEFNRKAMMSMYTIVFQLCIVNYRMMNYMLPPMDLYRMIVECCHNHLMKILNEASFFDDGKQLIQYYNHHWSNYTHSIKRVNIVFSYFHRDWISKQNEDIIGSRPPISFTSRGYNWWSKMLASCNNNDPIAILHLTPMMARGWFSVFFTQLELDKSDNVNLYSQTPQSPKLKPQSFENFDIYNYNGNHNHLHHSHSGHSQHNQQAQQQQQQAAAQNNGNNNLPQTPHVIHYDVEMLNDYESNFKKPTENQINRILKSLDKCCQQGEINLVLQFLISILQLQENLLYVSDDFGVSRDTIHLSSHLSSISANALNYKTIYKVLKSFNPEKQLCSAEFIDIIPSTTNSSGTNNNQTHTTHNHNNAHIHTHTHQYQPYPPPQQNLFSTTANDNQIVTQYESEPIPYQQLLNIQQQFNQHYHNQQTNAFSYTNHYVSVSTNPITSKQCQVCFVLNSNPPGGFNDNKMNRVVKKCFSILHYVHKKGGSNNLKKSK